MNRLFSFVARRPILSTNRRYNHPLLFSQLVQQYETKPTIINIFFYKRNYSNQNGNLPNIDPKQQTRRRGLQILTYLSGFIGACLLTAVGAREYERMKYRARGIVPITNRLYGRRPVIFRYRGFNLRQFAIRIIDDIHTFETREDDIWVVTFPKAGTTWLQEIVYLIHSDLDFDGAKSTKIDERFKFFEFPFPGLKTIAATPSPRLIKSHMPFSLLPNDIKDKKPKIIYMARNPKDTVVSFYHFATKFFAKENLFTGTFEDFCHIFADDQGSYGPWWKHVKEAWERRDEDNVLFILYEDLQTDFAGSVKKIAAFLGKTLSPSDFEALASHCSFDEMKKNPSLNYNWLKEMSGDKDNTNNFMRKGKVGDWKNHLSKEIVDKLDEMVATKLEPLGLGFQDSIEEDVTE